MNVAERMEQVREELVGLHARLAVLDTEEHRLRERDQALAADLVDPADDQGIEVLERREPALPGAIALSHGPEGLYLRAGPAGHDDVEFRRYEAAVRVYRREGAVAAAMTMHCRPSEVLHDLEATAARWPMVDGMPVIPLVDSVRAAFLRDAAAYCAAMGGVAAAAKVRQRPVAEVMGWIDEGVNLGVIEWPPPGEIGRAVSALVG